MNIPSLSLKEKFKKEERVADIKKNKKKKVWRLNIRQNVLPHILSHPKTFKVSNVIVRTAAGSPTSKVVRLFLKAIYYII